jgi:soluble lytic murein transglycosylase-like protein
MSLESAVARIDEIRTMLAPAAGTPKPAAPVTATPAFADVLSSALDTPSADDTSDDSGYDADIEASASREGVDPALVRAIVAHESGGNPNATSAAGAQGLMQLMPATARSLGVTDSYDPAQNIAGGTHLIRTLLDRYDGNLSLALAAYSAGPGAVDRFGGIPPYAETQAYVRDVLGSYTSERNTG